MTSQSNLSDFDLFRKCAVSDKNARSTFVNRFSGLVYDSIHKIFKAKNVKYNTEDIDDTFQNIFIKLFENNCKRIRQFQGKNGCSPATWIRTIAVRTTLDFVTTNKKFYSLNDSKEDKDPPLNLIKDSKELPDESLEKKEMEEIKEKVIKELSPQDQLFLKLYYERDLPPEEIAKIMNLSVNAIYSKKERLREKFEKILKKFELE